MENVAINAKFVAWRRVGDVWDQSVVIGYRGLEKEREGIRSKLKAFGAKHMSLFETTRYQSIVRIWPVKDPVFILEATGGRVPTCANRRQRSWEPFPN